MNGSVVMVAVELGVLMFAEVVGVAMVAEAVGFKLKVLSVCFGHEGLDGGVISDTSIDGVGVTGDDK